MQKMKNNNQGFLQCGVSFLKKYPVLIVFFCLYRQLAFSARLRTGYPIQISISIS